MEGWREQEAWNEVKFRAQQEWVSLAEYEDVRSVATRFVLALNHEDPEAERLVSENERYAVVEKVSGLAMRLARHTDPRSLGGRNE